MQFYDSADDGQSQSRTARFTAFSAPETPKDVIAIFCLDPPPFVANCYATAFRNDKLDCCPGRGVLYRIIGKIPQRALNHFGIAVHPHRPSRAD